MISFNLDVPHLAGTYLAVFPEVTLCVSGFTDVSDEHQRTCTKLYGVMSRKTARFIVTAGPGTACLV
jgi:hypothetical protein